MGYYTNFTIQVSPDAAAAIVEDFDKFNEQFEDITGYQLDSDDLSLYNVKWYDHEKDMRAVSKLYPDAVWQLDGTGEESGDVWRLYFKNGKMQSANTQVVVTHEEFDETKLK